MGRFRLASLVLVAPLLAALGACSDAPPDTGGVDTASAIAAFAASYASAYCGRLSQCNAYAPYLVVACEADPLANEQTAVAAGRATFDAAAADACLAQLASLDCGTWTQISETIPRTFPNTCGKVFGGEVAPGAACFTDAECEGGFCDLEPPACPGVCKRNKKPGDACTTQDCGYSEHACLGDDKCAPIGVAGDACHTSAYCGLGLACSSVEPPGGNCVPRATEGESCRRLQCAGDLVCDASSETCVARSPRGASCGTAETCGDGDVCKGAWVVRFDGPDAQAFPGTCAAAGQIGDACVPYKPEFTDTGCAVGLDCVNEKCAMPKPAQTVPDGGLCEYDEQCASGAACVTNACTSLACVEPAP